MASSYFRVIRWLSLSLLCSSLSCSPEDNTDASTSDSVAPTPNCIESGDIVVSNSGSDALVVLNPDGSFKNIAYFVSSASESLFGITWSAATNEVLVAVDGVDRIMGVSAVDCSHRTVVLDVNLTGNLRGITQLTSGDILVTETNAVERFGSNGNRVSAGWPLSLQTAGSGLSPLSNGGFVHCSTGSDVVRTYSSAGVQVATRASGIAGTTDAADCFTLRDGNIATAWSGTTDTVSIYSPALAPVATFSNTAYLAAPGGIAQRENGGNLLIVDRVYNTVVEITTSGAYVGSFGSGILSTPEFILVVP